MPAAELSSMTNTNSRMASWAMTTGLSMMSCPASAGLMRPHRSGVPAAPGRGHGAAPFANVILVFGPEILQRGQRRRCRGIAERAQRLARNQAGDVLEQAEVLHLAFAALDLLENV